MPIPTSPPCWQNRVGKAMRRNKPQERALNLKWPAWLCFAAIVVVYIAFRFHSLPIPLDRDEGMFGYAGQRILEGGKLYVDAVDHKPPGVFYLYALALSFFPPTAMGIHLFLAIYNFLTLVAVALLLRIRFPN